MADAGTIERSRTTDLEEERTQRRGSVFAPMGVKRATGFWPTLKRTAQEFQEDNLSDWAAALTYYGLVALWSASGYLGAFIRASNVIYETREGRPFWKLRPLQLVMTLVLVILLAVIALGVVLTGPIVSAVADPIGVSETAVTVWNFVKWLAVAGLFLLMIALIYHASPNVGGSRPAGSWPSSSGSWPPPASPSTSPSSGRTTRRTARSRVS